MKYLLFFYIFISLQLVAQSNPEEIALWKSALSKASHDSIKIELLVKLSYALYSDAAQEALDYAEEGLRICKQNNSDWFTENKAKLMHLTGIIHFINYDYTKAEKTFRKLLHFAVSQQDRELEGTALMKIAAIFGEKKLYDSALVYDLEALKIWDQLNSPNKAKSYNNLGILYKELRDYRTALRYYQKAIQIKLQDETLRNSVNTTYQNIGNIYAITENYDSCHRYYNLALKAANAIHDSFAIADILNNIGSTYLQEGKLEAAEKYLLEAHGLFESITKVDNFVPTIHELAKLYLLKKQAEKAEDLVLFAKEILIRNKRQHSTTMLANLDLRQQLAWVKGDYQKALGYSRSAINLSDSLHFEELKNQTYEVLVELDNERKESYINKLEQDRQIQQLENQKLLRQRWTLGISIGFLICISMLLFWVNRWRKRTNTQLKTLNDTKDKLFSIIAHDLKNPLSAFRSITQSLSEDIFNIEKEDLAYFINSLHQTADNLMELLQNLLYWAISQSGKLEYNPDSQSLYEISRKTIDLFKNNIQEKQLLIENEVDESLKVSADNKMLSTIIRNLLANAIKFTPEAGTIRLKATNNGDFIHFSIIDNGIGISPEDQKKLFTINNIKDSNPTKVEGSGTGLGLILCRELVERQGGKIWVKSTLGLGSSFEFSLPVKI